MTDEQIAREGLDVAAYSFKWRRAKILAEQNERLDDIRVLPYWERVRVLFLELGGEYKKEATR